MLLFIDFFKAFDFMHRGNLQQILIAYGIQTTTKKNKLTAIMMLYNNTKAMVHSPDEDSDFFDIVAGILGGDTLARYMFIICGD